MSVWENEESRRGLKKMKKKKRMRGGNWQRVKKKKKKGGWWREKVRGGGNKYGWGMVKIWRRGEGEEANEKGKGWREGGRGGVENYWKTDYRGEGTHTHTHTPYSVILSFFHVYLKDFYSHLRFFSEAAWFVHHWNRQWLRLQANANIDMLVFRFISCMNLSSMLAFAQRHKWTADDWIGRSLLTSRTTDITVSTWACTIGLRFICLARFRHQIHFVEFRRTLKVRFK